MTEPVGTPGPARSRASLWIEHAFILAIIAGYVHTTLFFIARGYLPQPWFYEPSGTFMDWYSLSFWAHNRGAYDIEQTIYPPLSFVVLKLFSLPQCYLTLDVRGEPSRDCDWLGIVGLSIMLCVNTVLIFKTFYKLDRRTGFTRGFAMAFGFPMIYAYERGNLLLFCFACVLLGFGPLLRSAKLRWLFAGAALNFKVYAISLVCAPLLRRRWMSFEGILVWAAIIYLVTWFILGEGDPISIYRNVTSYAEGFGASNPLDLWYPSSFIPVATLLNSSFPINAVFSSTQVDMILLIISVLVRTTQLAIVAAAVATWLRPEVVPQHRIYFIALALALTASEAGGYTQVLLLFFIFMERWKGIARPISICIAYILCIPDEIVLSRIMSLVRWSYLYGGEVVAEYGLGLMSLVRPAFVLLISVLLSAVTIRDVWKDIREQGWGRRWRYRHDIAMLPGVRRPEAGAARPATRA